MGTPGVAELVTTSVPFLTYLVFFKPFSIINSFVKLTYLSFNPKSDIFSQGYPFSAIYSLIGLGEEPLFIVDRSFNLYLISNRPQLLFNLVLKLMRSFEHIR